MKLDREAIRDANPLEDVIAELTGELLRPSAGEEKRFRCALHGDGVDKNPSGRVNIAKQEWYCDACAVGGDVFSFVMRQKGCTFKEALGYLAERAGIRNAT